MVSAMGHRSYYLLIIVRIHPGMTWLIIVIQLHWSIDMTWLGLVVGDQVSEVGLPGASIESILSDMKSVFV